MSMIRVGSCSKGFVLIFAGDQWPKTPIPLTEKEAADLYAQMGALLPDELLSVEPFSADNFSETEMLSGGEG